MWNRKYSLNKSRGILKSCYNWYRNNWKTLPKQDLDPFETKMELLDAALLRQDKKGASEKAKELESFSSRFVKTSFLHYFKEIVVALGVALLLAVVVRMTWFELYVIPTGSMRPTYKEQDHLIVSKTTHGINIPFLTDHFIFDPDLVVRGNPVIWSGDNIDIPNNDTTYFWLFPYKKRYIKRLMGKPGDTVYFYGGQVYVIDNKGEPVDELRTHPKMDKLEYIPFTSFEGQGINVKPDSSAMSGKIAFLHFNQPVGSVSFDWLGNAKGETARFDRYSDAYGIHNFAMTRLLTQSQANEHYSGRLKELPKTDYYLELKHHPQLKGKPIALFGPKTALLPTEVSLIPLDQKHQQRLMETLYTARFEVENGRAKLYSDPARPFNAYNPPLVDVPDGRYEFYEGKAYSIGFKGLSTELPKDHPVSRLNNLQTLYNLGTNFATVYSPNQAETPYSPARFAYYRSGDLYVMGSKLFDKEEPALKQFVETEKTKEVGFVDAGPPSKEEILKNGLRVPDNHYLVLGDNHAMSADSRFFGFVPEDNLQGTPTFIFWPIGSRWGLPTQTPHPYFSLPNVIVLSVFGTIALIWWVFHKRKIQKPLYKKLSS